jgi:hypothetical protein
LGFFTEFILDHWNPGLNAHKLLSFNSLMQEIFGDDSDLFTWVGKWHRIINLNKIISKGCHGLCSTFTFEGREISRVKILNFFKIPMIRRYFGAFTIIILNYLKIAFV